MGIKKQMALKPTNPKKTPITEDEFRQKLKNKDGDFQNRIFNFAITRDLLQETLGLAEDGNIHFNFDLDFADSEFQKIDVGSDILDIDDVPKVIFSRTVNFSEATFSKEAKFDGATFSDIANFFKATFSDIAIFWQATFSKEVDFTYATFSRAVYFDSATFSGEVDFTYATFSEEANFHEAKFLEKAYFSYAKFLEFSDIANFIGARFSEEASFIGATFSRAVYFDSARFSEEANFMGARFSEIADFGYVVFSQKVDFTNTIFLNEVQFRRATFSQDHHTYFCNLNLKQKDNPDKRNEKETYPAPRLQFRDTIFPQLVLFSNCNLSQTTFESCTIAGIKFRSCEFAKTGFFIFKRNAFENRTRQKSFIEKEIEELEKNNEKLQQQTQDKIQKLETSPLKLTKIIQFPKQIFQKKTKNKTQSTKIINFQKKKQATKELKKISLKLAKLNKKLHSIELETEEKRKDREDLCCQMKTALESSKEWKQAGDFYIGELEARRSKNWWEYLKLSFFKYLLGYAERISILFISITILFFAAALILGDSLYGFSFDGWFENYNWSCFEFDFLFFFEIFV